MQPSASGFFQQVDQLFASPAGSRGDDLVWTHNGGGLTEPAQVMDRATELGQQRSQPRGPLGNGDPEHRLHRQGQAEFGTQRAMPVMPVGQHQRLAVVPRLK